jgi:mRNA-degrading endonuclease RelE of RelBE toxin-antitoxin system
MMQPYEIFLRSEAIEALRKIPTNQRGTIVRFIDALADDPFITGDYTSEDSTGRLICIKVLSSYAVTFWADYPAKEIKITDVRSADRA